MAVVRRKSFWSYLASRMMIKPEVCPQDQLRIRADKGRHLGRKDLDKNCYWHESNEWELSWLSCLAYP
jgi:hypothetical protein